MYLQVDEGFDSHIKTLALCRMLKNPEAGIFMIRLWTWACRSAPDGDLSGMEAYDIETAVRYRPLDGACYDAMVRAGFIDEKPDGRKYIHKWKLRTGGDIEAMAAEAARKKAWRRHKNGHCGGVLTVDGVASGCPHCIAEATSAGRPPDIRPPSQGPAADKPTQTRPGQARPDQAKQDPEREEEAAPPPRCVGRDLQDWYGAERAKAFPEALPWQTPVSRDGKAETFAARLTPEEIADARPTMALHFAELKAGKGKADALQRPTLGFGCWMADFTTLRERLHGKTPAVVGPPPADKPCEFHARGANTGRFPPKHVWSKACSECRHVRARAAPREPTGAPVPAGELLGEVLRREAAR